MSNEYRKRNYSAKKVHKKEFNDGRVIHKFVWGGNRP